MHVHDAGLHKSISFSVKTPPSVNESMMTKHQLGSGTVSGAAGNVPDLRSSYSLIGANSHA